MFPSDIRPLLRCPLCDKLLQRPSTLHCGHSICDDHLSCPLHHTPLLSHHRQDVSLNKILTLLDRHSLHHLDADNLHDNDDDDHDDDDDLLSHLRSQSARQRALPADEPLIPSTSSSSSFEKDLLAELTCEICFAFFFEPVTTPCQHTFCSRCLHRSLDHSSACPLCRQQLPGFAYFHNHPQNETMLRLLLHVCPTAYQDRKEAIEAEERDARLNTPILVSHLSFPGMPTLLHFFEPRYRLMLRRCLASDHPSFGMIMSSSSSSSASILNPHGQVEYGTMLDIRSVQMLPDGRSIVETWGAWRFRILERGLLDGYVVARIERIDDFPDDQADDEEEQPEEFHLPHDSASSSSSSSPSSLQRRTSRSPPPSRVRSETQSPSAVSPPPPPISHPALTRPLPLSTAHLISHCSSFLSQLHTSTTPWVIQRLSYTHGPPPPTDPSDPDFDASNFSFYVGTVLPIDEWEKAKLLPVRSVRMRLKMCVWWIEGLRRSWWFERGCIIL